MVPFLTASLKKLVTSAPIFLAITTLGGGGSESHTPMCEICQKRSGLTFGNSWTLHSQIQRTIWQTALFWLSRRCLFTQGHTKPYRQIFLYLLHSRSISHAVLYLICKKLNIKATGGHQAQRKICVSLSFKVSSSSDGSLLC